MLLLEMTNIHSFQIKPEASFSHFLSVKSLKWDT